MQLLDQISRPFQILAAQGDNDLSDRRAVGELAGGVHQNRRAFQQHELLAAGARLFPAHARSQARGGKDDGDFHGRVYDCNWWDGLGARPGYRNLLRQRALFDRPAVVFRSHSVVRGAVDRMHAIVEAAEDHLAGGGLQHAGHGDIDGFRDHLTRVIHYHHGAVVQIRDALVIFLALFENEYPHQLAGEHHRLQGVRQFIDVQHFDAMQLRDLVQVEIVGHNLARVDLGQLNQLHIDFANVREVFFDDLDGQLRHFLDTLQDVETAPPAVALHRIGGIGHQLQLVQYELGDHQRSVHKAGLDDVGNASVDDDAGVEKPARALGPGLTAQQ